MKVYDKSILASALHENGVIDRREYADIIAGKECDFFNKIVMAFESVGDIVTLAMDKNTKIKPLLADASSFLVHKVKIEPSEVDTWLREKAFNHDLRKGAELVLPALTVNGKALLPHEFIEEVRRRGFKAEEIRSHEHNLMQGSVKIRITIPPQGM